MHVIDTRDGLSDVAVRVLDVLRVLPALELAELVEWTGEGWRVAPGPKGDVSRGSRGSRG